MAESRRIRYQQMDLRARIERSGRFSDVELKNANSEKMLFFVRDKDSEPKALKVFPQTKKGHDLAHREYNTYKDLNQKGSIKHVVRIYEQPIENLFEGVGLLMERADGSLLELMQHYNQEDIPRTDDVVFNWFSQILSGLREFTKIGASHNDLKPENVLLFYGPNDTEWLKISDLESSTRGGFASSSRAVSDVFSGPEGWEFVEGRYEYNTKYDIYACGLLLAQMLSHEMAIPFADKGGKIRYDTQTKEHKPYLERFFQANGINGIASDVILKCCQPKPKDRFDSYDEILDMLKGGSVEVKPPLDRTDYDAFNKLHSEMMQLLSSSNFHSSKYGTATMPKIDKIERARDTLKDLEDLIKGSDLAQEEDDVVAEIESKRGEFETARYKAAVYDGDALAEYLQNQIDNKSVSRSEVIEMWKINFLWGPPIATLQSDRKYGRERYTLAEIKSGKYLDGISPADKKRLKLE